MTVTTITAKMISSTGNCIKSNTLIGRKSSWTCAYIITKANTARSAGNSTISGICDGQYNVLAVWMGSTNKLIIDNEIILYVIQRIVIKFIKILNFIQVTLKKNIIIYCITMYQHILIIDEVYYSNQTQTQKQNQDKDPDNRICILINVL